MIISRVGRIARTTIHVGESISREFSEKGRLIMQSVYIYAGTRIDIHV